MRLWSISPEYLDRQGLLACWREGLLAQSCLIKGEYTECSKCDGTSKVKTYNWSTDGNVSPMMVYDIDCKKCKGIGKIKTPYYNHTQLNRFKNTIYKEFFIQQYLFGLYQESKNRGYKFNIRKICNTPKIPDINNRKLTVTKGQIKYEVKHLQKKLLSRDFERCCKLSKDKQKGLIKVHSLFKVVKGPIEEWEKYEK